MMVDDELMDSGRSFETSEEALRRRVIELSSQLDLLQEDLETLNYSVSHDLRAPLRSIEGFCQVLVEEYEAVLDATGQDYLRRVAAGARRMSDMLDGLLHLSRLGRSNMHRERVNLAGLAQGIVARLRSIDEAREVTFDIEEEVWADGDLDLLRVIVENLLLNAWKFTSRREGARIEVGVTVEGGIPVYYVRDNGAGFDMTYADKLFAPFQRMHPVTEFEGKGMGLALVQRAVHRHGGRVWAQAAEEQGATFRFTLEPAGGVS